MHANYVFILMINFAFRLELATGSVAQNDEDLICVKYFLGYVKLPTHYGRSPPQTSVKDVHSVPLRHPALKKHDNIG